MSLARIAAALPMGGALAYGSVGYAGGGARARGRVAGVTGAAKPRGCPLAPRPSERRRFAPLQFGHAVTAGAR